MQAAKLHMSIFIIYEYADHYWYGKLENHLSSLQRLGITISNNQKIACGRNGCLETMAAEAVIVNDACAGHSLHARNPYSYRIPILASRTGTKEIRDVIQAAQDGDEASRAALESAAEWIATIAVGGLINCSNPSLILLDGDIVREYDDFMPMIHRQAKMSSLETNWNAVQIKYCDLDFPVAYGAVANVIRHGPRTR